jgi:DNA-binding NarL/FixJ family response regulator
MEQLRVVVVDDHPIYRCGLVGLLEAGGVAVAGVADGVEEAMAVVRATRPDAVLTDLYLSDGSGIELVKRVVAHDPRIRTVVLTVSHDSNEMLAAIRAGADGFLTKEQAPERLVRALEGVFVGEAALSRQMTGYLVRDLRDGDRRVALASHFPHRERLTPRQLEILQLIAAGHSTAVIADQLCLSPRRCAGTSSRSCASCAPRTAPRRRPRCARSLSEQLGASGARSSPCRRRCASPTS